MDITSKRRIANWMLLLCLQPLSAMAQSTMMRTDEHPTAPASSPYNVYLDYRPNAGTVLADRLGITHARPRYLSFLAPGTAVPATMNVLKVGAQHATGLGFRNMKIWATQEVFDPNFYGMTFTSKLSPSQLIAQPYYTAVFSDLESQGVQNVNIEFTPWIYDASGNRVGIGFSLDTATDFNTVKSTFIDSGVVENSTYDFTMALLGTGRRLNFVIQNHEVESHSLYIGSDGQAHAYAYSFRFYKLYFEAVQRGVNRARAAAGATPGTVEQLCEFTGAPTISSNAGYYDQSTNPLSGANYILPRMATKCDRVGFSAWNYMNQAGEAAERLAFVANGALESGAVLNVGEPLYTRDFRMLLQGDGNLVVYRNDNNAVTFYTGSTGHSCSSNCFGIFQGDGNFVLYDNGSPYWWSGTSGQQGTAFELIIARANGIPAIRRKTDGAVIWPTPNDYSYVNGGYYGAGYRDISVTNSNNNIPFYTKVDISEFGNIDHSWPDLSVNHQVWMLSLSPYVDRLLLWILYDNECSNTQINVAIAGCRGLGFYNPDGTYSGLASVVTQQYLNQTLRARTDAQITTNFGALVGAWGPYPANDGNATLYASSLASALVSEYRANTAPSIFDVETRIRNALVVSNGTMSKDYWRDQVANMYLEILHRPADTGGLYFWTAQILASGNPSSKYNDVRAQFQGVCNSNPPACAAGQM